MISILRVLVLTAFAALAFALAFRKEQHQITYRLIFAFVAVGTTTFLPEDAIFLQLIAGFSLFFLLSVILQIVLRMRLGQNHSKEKQSRRA